MPAQPSSHSRQHALRLGRTSAAGQRYLITFVSHLRARWFADPAVAGSACRSLSEPLSWRRSRCLAWVLMPDHWHGVVRLGTNDDLARLVNRLKSHSARAIHRETGDAARIWASGFHDRMLRSEAHAVAAGRYVIANPVRAGIVADASDYPFWGALWMDRG